MATNIGQNLSISKTQTHYLGIQKLHLVLMMIRDSTRTESMLKIEISRNPSKSPKIESPWPTLTPSNLCPGRFLEHKGCAIWSLDTLTRAGRRGFAIWRSDPEHFRFLTPNRINSYRYHLGKFRRRWSTSIAWNRYHFLSNRIYKPFTWHGGGNYLCVLCLNPEMLQI